MKRPAVVAIVGRPNVGKSTLFNRIVRRRAAIVHDQPGVTRDRNYAQADWNGVGFVLIDTGGYFAGSEDVMERAVLSKIEEAVTEANAVVFLVDGRSGVTGMDAEIAGMLHRSGKPVLLAVNKIDDALHEPQVTDFYRLGFGDPQPVSAISGRQVGDFLDGLVALLPGASDLHADSGVEEAPADPSIIRLAIVGRPNVGKSSLVNALIGHEQQIVTDVPGTTRDAIDTELRYQHKQIILIDTAGLRKRSRVKESVEFFSNVRTHDAIRRCDVVALLIDAEDGLADQDLHILEEVVKLQKGIILAVNKWDLVEKDADTIKQYEAAVHARLRIHTYARLIFISAKTQKRVFKLIDLVLRVHRERLRQIRTSELNDFLQAAIKHYSPPSMDKKEIKLNYCTQVKTGPPVFVIFSNHPKSIRQNYRQYLENSFRERFGFVGVPLTFKFRKK